MGSVPPGPPLNDAQAAVVAADHPRLLVLAGAGTGKTRTLTRRVARLVADGCPPEAVVLATFTHRAAHEMIRRLRTLLGPDAARIRAGTFHALGHRALVAHGPALGWPAPRAIVTRGEQLDLMAQAARAHGAGEGPGPRALVELYARALNTQRPAAAVARDRAPDLDPGRVEAILDTYAAQKARLGAVDFDDLLLFLQALALDDGPQARAHRAGIRHVLVDEYQDVTPLQAEIAERLAGDGAHLCVVGDDAQSIYGWRGARPDALAHFADAAPTRIHRLTDSYRCAPGILAVAHAARPPSAAPLALTATRPPGPPPAIVEAPRPADQAAFVAQRIAERRAEGLPLDRIAVLYRVHRHALPLELALTRWRIPHVTRTGPRRLEQPHLRDAIAALRIAVDPTDRLAWPRLLARVPHVGPRRAAQVVEAVATPGDAATALREAARALPAPARAGLDALAEVVEHLRADPAGAIADWASSPSPALFREDELDEAARADLDQLATWAAETDDVRALLDALALDDPRGPETTRDAVTTGTVHQAKGLEWDAVFVIGLDEGAFPLRRADDDPADAEEERRLFYVAVTRARDELYLVSGGGDPERYAPPSRFLSGLTGAERWRLA